MAYSCKHFCFLFLLLIFSSIQIQARQSRFFSKVTHYSVTKNNGKKDPIASVPIQAPTPAPTPAPAPALLVEAPAPAPVFSTDSEYGYGLFGPGSGMFLPKKDTSMTTTTTAANELLNEELDGVTYNEKYESSNYNNNNNGYKLGSARYETGNQNNGYTNNYNNNNNGYNGNHNYNGYKLAGESYETSNQNNENGYSNYDNNGYRTNNYNNNNGYTTNNNGYTTNYNNNGYNTERQGMSDTRYMEGGKYYHNVKNENYYPSNDEFESGKVSTQNQGYYGNNESPNEFNTMEYENQEGYEENQEEPFP